MYGVQSWLPASHSGGGFFSRNLLIIVASESSLTIVRSKSKTANDAIFQKTRAHSAPFTDILRPFLIARQGQAFAKIGALTKLWHFSFVMVNFYTVFRNSSRWFKVFWTDIFHLVWRHFGFHLTFDRIICLNNASFLFYSFNYIYICIWFMICLYFFIQKMLNIFHVK